MTKVGSFALDLIGRGRRLAGAIVFDADALTVLAGEPRRILRAGAVGRRAGAGADAA